MLSTLQQNCHCNSAVHRFRIASVFNIQHNMWRRHRAPPQTKATQGHCHAGEGCFTNIAITSWLSWQALSWVSQAAWPWHCVDLEASSCLLTCLQIRTQTRRHRQRRRPPLPPRRRSPPSAPCRLRPRPRPCPRALAVCSVDGCVTSGVAGGAAGPGRRRG